MRLDMVDVFLFTADNTAISSKEVWKPKQRNVSGIQRSGRKGQNLASYINEDTLRTIHKSRFMNRSFIMRALGSGQTGTAIRQ